MTHRWNTALLFVLAMRLGSAAAGEPMAKPTPHGDPAFRAAAKIVAGTPMLAGEALRNASGLACFLGTTEDIRSFDLEFPKEDAAKLACADKVLKSYFDANEAILSELPETSACALSRFVSLPKGFDVTKIVQALQLTSMMGRASGPWPGLASVPRATAASTEELVLLAQAAGASLAPQLEKLTPRQEDELSFCLFLARHHSIGNEPELVQMFRFERGLEQLLQQRREKREKGAIDWLELVREPLKFHAALAAPNFCRKEKQTSALDAFLYREQKIRNARAGLVKRWRDADDKIGDHVPEKYDAAYARDITALLCHLKNKELKGAPEKYAALLRDFGSARRALAVGGGTPAPWVEHALLANVLGLSEANVLARFLVDGIPAEPEKAAARKASLSRCPGLEAAVRRETAVQLRELLKDVGPFRSDYYSRVEREDKLTAATQVKPTLYVTKALQDWIRKVTVITELVDRKFLCTDGPAGAEVAAQSAERLLRGDEELVRRLTQEIPAQDAQSHEFLPASLSFRHKSGSHGYCLLPASEDPRYFLADVTEVAAMKKTLDELDAILFPSRAVTPVPVSVLSTNLSAEEIAKKRAEASKYLAEQLKTPYDKKLSAAKLGQRRAQVAEILRRLVDNEKDCLSVGEGGKYPIWLADIEEEGGPQWAARIEKVTHRQTREAGDALIKILGGVADAAVAAHNVPEGQREVARRSVLKYELDQILGALWPDASVTLRYPLPLELPAVKATGPEVSLIEQSFLWQASVKVGPAPKVVIPNEPVFRLLDKSLVGDVTRSMWDGLFSDPVRFAEWRRSFVAPGAENVVAQVRKHRYPVLAAAAVREELLNELENKMAGRASGGNATRLGFERKALAHLRADLCQRIRLDAASGLEAARDLRALVAALRPLSKKALPFQESFLRLMLSMDGNQRRVITRFLGENKCFEQQPEMRDLLFTRLFATSPDESAAPFEKDRWFKDVERHFVACSVLELIAKRAKEEKQERGRLARDIGVASSASDTEPLSRQLLRLPLVELKGILAQLEHLPTFGGVKLSREPEAVGIVVTPPAWASGNGRYLPPPIPSGVAAEGYVKGALAHIDGIASVLFNLEGLLAASPGPVRRRISDLFNPAFGSVFGVPLVDETAGTYGTKEEEAAALKLARDTWAELSTKAKADDVAFVRRHVDAMRSLLGKEADDDDIKAILARHEELLLAQLGLRDLLALPAAARLERRKLILGLSVEERALEQTVERLFDKLKKKTLTAKAVEGAWENGLKLSFNALKEMLRRGLDESAKKLDPADFVDARSLLHIRRLALEAVATGKTNPPQIASDVIRENGRLLRLHERAQELKAAAAAVRRAASEKKELGVPPKVLLWSMANERRRLEPEFQALSASAHAGQLSPLLFTSVWRDLELARGEMEDALVDEVMKDRPIPTVGSHPEYSMARVSAREWAIEIPMSVLGRHPSHVDAVFETLRDRACVGYEAIRDYSSFGYTKAGLFAWDQQNAATRQDARDRLPQWACWAARACGPLVGSGIVERQEQCREYATVYQNIRSWIRSGAVTPVMPEGDPDAVRVRSIVDRLTNRNPDFIREELRKLRDSDKPADRAVFRKAAAYALRLPESQYGRRVVVELVTPAHVLEAIAAARKTRPAAELRELDRLLPQAPLEWLTREWGLSLSVPKYHADFPKLLASLRASVDFYRREADKALPPEVVKEDKSKPVAADVEQAHQAFLEDLLARIVSWRGADGSLDFAKINAMALPIDALRKMFKNAALLGGEEVALDKIRYFLHAQRVLLWGFKNGKQNFVWLHPKLTSFFPSHAQMKGATQTQGYHSATFGVAELRTVDDLEKALAILVDRIDSERNGYHQARAAGAAAFDQFAQSALPGDAEVRRWYGSHAEGSVIDVMRDAWDVTSRQTLDTSIEYKFSPPIANGKVLEIYKRTQWSHRTEVAEVATPSWTTPRFARFLWNGPGEPVGGPVALLHKFVQESELRTAMEVFRKKKLAAGAFLNTVYGFPIVLYAGDWGNENRLIRHGIEDQKWRKQSAEYLPGFQQSAAEAEQRFLQGDRYRGVPPHVAELWNQYPPFLRAGMAKYLLLAQQRGPNYLSEKDEAAVQRARAVLMEPWPGRATEFFRNASQPFPKAGDAGLCKVLVGDMAAQAQRLPKQGSIGKAREFAVSDLVKACDKQRVFSREELREKALTVLLGIYESENDPLLAAVKQLRKEAWLQSPPDKHVIVLKRLLMERVKAEREALSGKSLSDLDHGALAKQIALTAIHLIEEQGNEATGEQALSLELAKGGLDRFSPIYSAVYAALERSQNGDPALAPILTAMDEHRSPLGTNLSLAQRLPILGWSDETTRSFQTFHSIKATATREGRERAEAIHKSLQLTPLRSPLELIAQFDTTHQAGAVNAMRNSKRVATLAALMRALTDGSPLTASLDAFVTDEAKDKWVRLGAEMFPPEARDSSEIPPGTLQALRTAFIDEYRRRAAQELLSTALTEVFQGTRNLSPEQLDERRREVLDVLRHVGYGSPVPASQERIGRIAERLRALLRGSSRRALASREDKADAIEEAEKRWVGDELQAMFGAWVVLRGSEGGGVATAESAREKASVFLKKMLATPYDRKVDATELAARRKDVVEILRRLVNEEKDVLGVRPGGKTPGWLGDVSRTNHRQSREAADKLATLLAPVVDAALRSVPLAEKEAKRKEILLAELNGLLDTHWPDPSAPARIAPVLPKPVPGFFELVDDCRAADFDAIRTTQFEARRVDPVLEAQRKELFSTSERLRTLQRQIRTARHTVFLVDLKLSGLRERLETARDLKRREKLDHPYYIDDEGRGKLEEQIARMVTARSTADASMRAHERTFTAILSDLGRSTGASVQRAKPASAAGELQKMLMSRLEARKSCIAKAVEARLAAARAQGFTYQESQLREQLMHDAASAVDWYQQFSAAALRRAEGGGGGDEPPDELNLLVGKPSGASGLVGAVDVRAAWDRELAIARRFVQDRDEAFAPLARLGLTRDALAAQPPDFSKLRLGAGQTVSDQQLREWFREAGRYQQGALFGKPLPKADWAKHPLADFLFETFRDQFLKKWVGDGRLNTTPWNDGVAFRVVGDEKTATYGLVLENLQMLQARGQAKLDKAQKILEDKELFVDLRASGQHYVDWNHKRTASSNLDSRVASLNETIGVLDDLDGVRFKYDNMEQTGVVVAAHLTSQRELGIRGELTETLANMEADFYWKWTSVALWAATIVVTVATFGATSPLLVAIHAGAEGAMMINGLTQLQGVMNEVGYYASIDAMYDKHFNWSDTGKSNLISSGLFFTGSGAAAYVGTGVRTATQIAQRAKNLGLTMEEVGASVRAVRAAQMKGLAVEGTEAARLLQSLSGRESLAAALADTQMALGWRGALYRGVNASGPLFNMGVIGGTNFTGHLGVEFVTARLNGRDFEWSGAITKNLSTELSTMLFAGGFDRRIADQFKRWGVKIAAAGGVNVGINMLGHSISGSIQEGAIYDKIDKLLKEEPSARRDAELASLASAMEESKKREHEGGAREWIHRLLVDVGTFARKAAKASFRAQSADRAAARLRAGDSAEVVLRDFNREVGPGYLEARIEAMKSKLTFGRIHQSAPPKLAIEAEGGAHLLLALFERARAGDKKADGALKVELKELQSRLRDAGVNVPGKLLEQYLKAFVSDPEIERLPVLVAHEKDGKTYYSGQMVDFANWATRQALRSSAEAARTAREGARDRAVYEKALSEERAAWLALLRHDASAVDRLPLVLITEPGRQELRDLAVEALAYTEGADAAVVGRFVELRAPKTGPRPANERSVADVVADLGAAYPRDRVGPLRWMASQRVSLIDYVKVFGTTADVREVAIARVLEVDGADKKLIADASDYRRFVEKNWSRWGNLSEKQWLERYRGDLANRVRT